MFKTKYFLNPQTLRYEKVEHPVRRIVFSSFFGFLFLLLLAGGLRIGFDRVADSPKIKIFKEKNKELKFAYDNLLSEISLAERFLNELQNRDDEVYRSVLNQDPIPRSMREAGFGGSENYSDYLMSRSDEFVVNTARQLEKLVNKVKIQSKSLYDLQEIAEDQKALIAAIPSLHPISPANFFWLSSSFGYRKDPFTKRKRMHIGVDFAGDLGLKIYASGNGIVVEASISKHGYGKEILIDHGFGYTSRYAHLNKIHVKTGQKIKRGQLIGDMGNSGRSTGSHLHYEVRLFNKPLNPMYFFYEDLTSEEYSEIVAQVSN